MSALIPLCNTLVWPHLDYTIQASSPILTAGLNHLQRMQRLATRLIEGLRHLPCGEKLRQLGQHSLNQRQLSNLFNGEFNHVPRLLFAPTVPLDLRGNPFEVHAYHCLFES